MYCRGDGWQRVKILYLREAQEAARQSGASKDKGLLINGKAGISVCIY